MGKTLGYMITFTTYGTWLQGNKRGYVKDGRTHSGNRNLMYANKFSQSGDSVVLSSSQQKLVAEAIVAEAKLWDQQIYALAVKANHLHIVTANTKESVSKMVVLQENRPHGIEGQWF